MDYFVLHPGPTRTYLSTQPRVKTTQAGMHSRTVHPVGLKPKRYLRKGNVMRRLFFVLAGIPSPPSIQVQQGLTNTGSASITVTKRVSPTLALHIGLSFIGALFASHVHAQEAAGPDSPALHALKLESAHDYWCENLYAEHDVAVAISMRADNGLDLEAKRNLVTLIHSTAESAMHFKCHRDGSAEEKTQVEQASHTPLKKLEAALTFYGNGEFEARNKYFDILHNRQ